MRTAAPPVDALVDADVDVDLLRFDLHDRAAHDLVVGVRASAGAASAPRAWRARASRHLLPEVDHQSSSSAPARRLGRCRLRGGVGSAAAGGCGGGGGWCRRRGRCGGCGCSGGARRTGLRRYGGCASAPDGCGRAGQPDAARVDAAATAAGVVASSSRHRRRRAALIAKLVPSSRAARVDVRVAADRAAERRARRSPAASSAIAGSSASTTTRARRRPAPWPSRRRARRGPCSCRTRDAGYAGDPDRVPRARTRTPTTSDERRPASEAWTPLPRNRLPGTWAVHAFFTRAADRCRIA